MIEWVVVWVVLASAGVAVGAFIARLTGWHRDAWDAFRRWDARRLDNKEIRARLQAKKRLIVLRWDLKKCLEEQSDIEQVLESLPEPVSSGSIRDNTMSTLEFQQEIKRDLSYKLRAEIECLEMELGIDSTEEPRPADKREELRQIRVRIAEMRMDEEQIEKEILDEQGGDGPHRRQARVQTDD